MSNNVVVGIGLVIIIAGVAMILLSGADIGSLQLNDITASFAGAEVTATDVSPESQTMIVSGFAASIVGLLVLGAGAKMS